MPKSGKKYEKFEKVAKSGEKWGLVGKSLKKWQKVAKSWNKWRKVGISGETWGKVGKSETFFFAKWPRRPFWMTKNYFRSHFSPFQINTQLLFF